MQNIIRIVQDKHLKYAILSDYAALWVKSNQENPLPMDYPFIFNNQTALINPFISQMKQEKGSVMIIVDRSYLLEKQGSSPSDVFRIALIVPKYFTKVYETKYFVLYSNFFQNYAQKNKRNNKKRNDTY